MRESESFSFMKFHSISDLLMTQKVSQHDQVFWQCSGVVYKLNYCVCVSDILQMSAGDPVFNNCVFRFVYPTYSKHRSRFHFNYCVFYRTESGRQKRFHFKYCVFDFLYSTKNRLRNILDFLIIAFHSIYRGRWG